MSGPPPKEPKGGAPVATWAEAGRAAKSRTEKKRREISLRTGRVMARRSPCARNDRIRRCVRVMVVSSVLLNIEQAGGQAGVEDDGFGLEVEKEAVVQVFPNVERNLCAANRSIVAETNLDWECRYGTLTVKYVNDQVTEKHFEVNAEGIKDANSELLALAAFSSGQRLLRDWSMSVLRSLR